MSRELVRGNVELSRRLSVHQNTIYRWKRDGVLAPAIVSEYCKTIIYDFDKVLECLNHKPVGRR